MRRTALMATELESKRKSLSGLPGRSSRFPAPWDSPLSHSMVTRLRRDGSFVGIHQSVPKDRSGAKQLYGVGRLPTQ